jgi:hypothetical protein
VASPTSTVIVEQKTVVNDAYHGTSGEFAQLIESQGFKVGGVGGFLGRGAYFFQGADAFEWAHWWAEKCCKEGKFARPLGMIKASIELGLCLDYENPEHTKLIRKVADILKKRLGSRPFDESNVVDLIAYDTKIDTVRAPHYEKVFSQSHFSEFKVYYICVRNIGKILSLQIHLTWS